MADLNETNEYQIRVQSLTTQKNHLDDLIRDARKREQLSKAYKRISDINATSTMKKMSKNVKSNSKK